MAVTWLDNKNLSRVYFYDASAATYTQRTLTGTFDLFADDAAVGDFVMFAGGQPWKDVTLDITTPLAAVGLTGIWEFNSGQTGSWLTLSGLVDGTQAFTRSGVNKIVFDPPDRMRDFWAYGVMPYIRFRITGLTSITEGGAAAATPTCGSNRILVDGYSVGTPCRMSDIYSADLAGTRLLAPELPCTTGMTITRIFPAEMGAQRLIFTLAGTTAGAGDTLDLVGTGAEGEAVTESIDVSAGNGTYTSAYSYYTLTSFACTGWTDGTVKVEQGRWGNVWRMGYIGDQYTTPRLYTIDRCQFVTATTAYFKMLNEVMIVNRSAHDRGAQIALSRNVDLDQSIVVEDNRVGNFATNTEDTSAIVLGDSAYVAKNNTVDDSVLFGLKGMPSGSYYFYTYDAPIVESFIGNVGGYWFVSPGQTYFPTFTRSVINYSLLWFQPQTTFLIYDFGNSFLTGQFYCVAASWALIRNLTIGTSVGFQSQAGVIFLLQDVVAASYPSTISPSGSAIWRMYSFNLKVIDEAGNPIQNASVRIQDVDGNDYGYQTTIAVNDGTTTHTYIDVYDGSQFSAGHIIKQGWVVSPTWERTISSVVIGGGAGGKDRLNLTAQNGSYMYANQRIRNTSQYLLTNASGDTPSNYLIYRIIGNAGTVDYSPHTITISKSGYITETIKITMDEAKKQVVVLSQVKDLNFSKHIKINSQSRS